jgi:DNA-binding protein
MENDVIVLNLEQNINRLIAAIELLPKKEAEHGVVAAIEAINIPTVELTPVIEEIRSAVDSINKIKFPEVSFKDEGQSITAAIDAVKAELIKNRRGAKYSVFSQRKRNSHSRFCLSKRRSIFSNNFQN